MTKRSVMQAVPAMTAGFEPPPAFTMRANRKTPGPMLNIPARSDAILEPSERSYRPPHARHANDRPRRLEGSIALQLSPTSLPQRGQVVRDWTGSGMTKERRERALALFADPAVFV
jgi:hypothetical protein